MGSNPGSQPPRDNPDGGHVDRTITRKRTGAAGGALAAVLPNQALRNVLIAEAGVSGTANISVVVLTVFAFQVGGADLVALAFGLRFLGVGALRPVVGIAIDNLSPRDGLRTGSVIGSVGAALCVIGGLIGSTVGVVGVIAGTCLLKLGHSIAKSGRRAAIAFASDAPEEAAATISLLTTVNSAAALIGPLFASLALLTIDVGGALLVAAMLYVGASAVMWNLPVPSETPMPAGSVRQVLSGQRETLRAPVVVFTFALIGAAAFLNGASAVFYAPLAAEVLSSGEAGVGLLRMAFGVGGLVTSLALVRGRARARSHVQLAAGVAIWGAVLVVLPHAGLLAVALIPMLGMGSGRTLVDGAYLTLLQRSLPESLHPRVLGLGETVNFLAGGIGALAAAPLIGVMGLTWAMTTLGLAAVVMAVAAGIGLRRHREEAAAPTELTDLLRSTPTLGLLPPIELDLLALRMRRRMLAPGDRLITAGDEGDSWFVIAEGSLDVSSNDQTIATIGRGDGVGEIALLRSCPRTATVIASTDGVAFELGQSTFLRAVGLGDRSSFDDLVALRLSESRGSDT